MLRKKETLEKKLEKNLIEANHHLNAMISQIEDISGDSHLHKLPDYMKILKYFKRGLNGTYKKIEEYDHLRQEMETKLENTDIEYKYQENRLYLYDFIREPYSYRYPQAFYIRFTAHVLAHIELGYYLRQQKKELGFLYSELEKRLKDDFVRPEL